MQLLCLSNGHGEDIIAVRILEQIRTLFPTVKLFALPIVGEGFAYQQAQIPLLGKVKKMPSGGFIYMDGKQLLRDVQGGLLQLTWSQYQVVRNWGKQGGKILAVGDIVPLLFAWLSGSDYAFIGTAKSDYYLKDELGWLPQTSPWEKWMASVYYPHERWLMTRPLCRGVFPRDALTTEGLQKWSVPAFDLGNPMMDGLEVSRDKESETLTILLLPGSRFPESIDNWTLILSALNSLEKSFLNRPISCLGAISPSLDLTPFKTALEGQGWRISKQETDSIEYQRNLLSLQLSQQRYQDYLQQADLSLAMAGTATEQFVGLGKPAFTLAGKGPQMTYQFAEAQTRLLGVSVILLDRPETFGENLKKLLSDPDQLQQINDNGRRRMGKAGSAYRIAQCLGKVLFNLKRDADPIL